MKTVQCYLHLDEDNGNDQTDRIMNPKSWEFALKEMKAGGWLVTLEHSKKRTSLQNGYLWSAVYPLALKGFKDLGYDIDDKYEVHEVFKSLFLKKHIESDDGTVIEYVGSTKKLTTVEFNEYIERIVRFSAENLSVSIPEPGQPISMYQ